MVRRGEVRCARRGAIRRDRARRDTVRRGRAGKNKPEEKKMSEEQQEQNQQNGTTEEQDGKEALEQVLAVKREEIRVAARLTKEDWPDERIKVIANIIAPQGTTQQELAAFLGVCDRYKLDPIVGEIWLVYDGNKQKHLIMTGRDSYLAIADRHPDYEGFIHGTVREGDEFEVIREGTEVTVNHILGPERGQRISAYCVCYRKGRKPVLIVRDWKSYGHLQAKKNWKNNPDDMLEARAITQSHRLQFRIPGLYTVEEIPEASEAGTSAADRARDAVAGTRSRMEEMKARFRGEETTGEEPAEEPPEETDINVAALMVEFGQFKGSSWAKVFTDPKGPGYVKHFVLEREYDHPSLTAEVKAGLLKMVVEWDQSREEETPQEGPDEAEEDQSITEGAEAPKETPEPSKGPLEALDELWHEGQEMAAVLAKTNDLDPEHADGLDDLREKEDTDGLQKLVGKLKAQLATNLEKGIDPQLGF